MGYSFWLAARVLLYAPSHRQDSIYHGLCYTSREALAGTRNSSMGPPHEGSIWRPIAPWANALTTELHLAPAYRRSQRVVLAACFICHIWVLLQLCQFCNFRLFSGTLPLLIISHLVIIGIPKFIMLKNYNNFKKIFWSIGKGQNYPLQNIWHYIINHFMKIFTILK